VPRAETFFWVLLLYEIGHAFGNAKFFTYYYVEGELTEEKWEF
jgi:hypothetical protein